MSEGDEDARRVRFFSVHDLAGGLYVQRVAELAEQFDPAKPPTAIADLVELHNVQRYLEHGFLPHGCSDADRARAESRIPQIRSVVARFFSSIDDTNCSTLITDIDFEYHADLVALLGRNKAFERCSPTSMLPTLDRAGIRLGEILASKKLVGAYDRAIRDLLAAAPKNAEHLVRKYLQNDVKDEIHIPASFTPRDARALLEGYIESPDANPNYVGLIATAPVNASTGIDAKLKLRAKRRSAEMTQQLFERTAGMKTGCEVGMSETQDEPVRFEMDESDGLVARYTYSRDWLDQTCDNPSILNNFQHLFEFADGHALLTMPSYPSNLGVVERFLMTTGKTDYHLGVAFRAIDMSTLLQTRLYQHYLVTNDIELEDVIAWFFERYLVEEFGALNFSFIPSGNGTSYLQKVRHLFAEMESVATQFSLFAQNGELDRDLLTMTSDQVRYRELPSLVEGKYVYRGSGDEITGVLHALFSDQSRLTYIDDVLRADDAVALLIEKQVTYSDFHHYQLPAIDHLIELGLLVNTGTRVRIADADQILVLKMLFTTQAANYYYLSTGGRAAVDEMVAKGWVTRRASLLTEAESQYFNYFLNRVEFSNGPELRNKYLHGSQANADGEDAHFHTYITALRLTVALIIKINDDFCLAATLESESAYRSDDGSSTAPTPVAQPGRHVTDGTVPDNQGSLS